MCRCDGSLGLSEFLLGRVTVADVGVWHDTKGDTEIAEHAEESHDIVESTVLGIEFRAALFIMRNLTRQSCIEDETEGIDSRIRSGVERIDLVSLTESLTYTAHTLIEAYALVCQIAQAKLAVRRVSALCIGTRRCQRGKSEATENFIHILYFISIENHFSVQNY